MFQGGPSFTSAQAASLPDPDASSAILNSAINNNSLSETLRTELTEKTDFVEDNLEQFMYTKKKIKTSNNAKQVGSFFFFFFEI